MDITFITEDFAVTGQLNAAQIGQVNNLGFKSIICNRPDGEDLGQPLFEAIAAAAGTTGLTARYVPIAKADPSPEDVKAFARAYDELSKPILAYSRKGRRSQAVFESAYGRE